MEISWPQSLHYSRKGFQSGALFVEVVEDYKSGFIGGVHPKCRDCITQAKTFTIWVNVIGNSCILDNK